MKHKNSFDVARHLAAIGVMISHHFAFFSLPEPRVLGITKLGTFSVIVFFAISGFLISNSYIRSASILDYLNKRVRRIFPGLIFCSAFMVFILCPIFGTGNGYDFFFSLSSIESFIHYSLMGWTPVDSNGFASNYIHKDMLNGSLWTLRFEFFDYVIIALALAYKRTSIAPLAVVLVSSIIIQIVIQKGYFSSYFVSNSTMLTIPFFVGSIMALTFNFWNTTRTKITLSLGSVILSLFIMNGNDNNIAFYILTTVFVISTCYIFKDKIISGRFDISYGIYIYAYPIQQIIVNESGLSFFMSLILSIVLVMSMATVSWFFVEKVFLSRTKEVTISPLKKPII